jgi:L-lactate dehydrogenase
VLIKPRLPQKRPTFPRSLFPCRYIRLRGSAFSSDASQQVYSTVATHPTMPASSSTIAILGAGSVGSAIAQTLLLRRIVADIILVDIDHELCQAQVQDLSDATHLFNVRIRQGNHADAGQADVIIISAGAKQRPGDTRLDLIDRNLEILGSVLEAMKPIRHDAILLLIANPVDALTYFAQKMSSLPRNQVLGSGTLLDSIRLRGILADKLEASQPIGIRTVNSATA